ncbi:hypothetical protein C8F04DRAFT_1103599 [Mycena alexandri]|uniref:Uncharacterized protein n=1 Tax=Mycena alexandri TaxID=1745969 RepID=A0AAD6X6E2_9AGAR|nr:hypothetical protein C8F04DRAFT_1103599 [Mycena alexandri]
MPFTTERFDLLWKLTTRVLISTGISLLLYGIYICLFLLSIRVLSRRAAPGRKILIVSSCVMAVFGTITTAILISDAVISVRRVQELVHGQSLKKLEDLNPLGIALNVIYIINVAISDTFFLYRCYVIWGYQKKITILPAALILSTFIVGILVMAREAPLVVTYYVLAVATNIVLTTLTAGRILWAQYHASRFSGDAKLRSRYDTAFKLILESGAIYCIWMMILLISFLRDGDVHTIAGTFATEGMNIIPTFTLVYVGLKSDNSGDPTQENTSHGPPSEPPVAPRMRTTQGRNLSQILDIKPSGERTDNV